MGVTLSSLDREPSTWERLHERTPAPLAAVPESQVCKVRAPCAQRRRYLAVAAVGILLDPRGYWMLGRSGSTQYRVSFCPWCGRPLEAPE